MKKTIIKIFSIVTMLYIGTGYSFAISEEYSYGLIFEEIGKNGSITGEKISDGKVKLYDNNGKFVKEIKKFGDIDKKDIIYDEKIEKTAESMFLENGNLYEDRERTLEISKIPGYENTYGYFKGYYDKKDKEDKFFLSIYNKDKKIFEEYNFEKEGYKELEKSKNIIGAGLFSNQAVEENGKIYISYKESYEGEVKIIDIEKKEIRNVVTWIPSNKAYLSKNLVRNGKIYNMYIEDNNEYKLIEYDTATEERKELCSVEDSSDTYNTEKVEKLKGFFLKRDK